ncbi:hypothetical protein [Streptosporangium sp. NPDC051022]
MKKRQKNVKTEAKAVLIPYRLSSPDGDVPDSGHVEPEEET